MTVRVGSVVLLDRAPLGDRAGVSRWLDQTGQNASTAAASAATPTLSAGSSCEWPKSTPRRRQALRIQSP